MRRKTDSDSLKRAEHDVIAIGIAIAAILLFVGIGGAAVPQIVQSWLGHGKQPDQVLISAMLLNIALIIFGWRRYDELAREVNERRRAENQARELAETDPLTGCLNRRSVASAVSDLGHHASAGGFRVAALLFDLDNFKPANDTHGHLVGDQLLEGIAKRVASTIPAEALLARLGGDEFCCFMPFNPRHPDQVEQTARQILAAVGKPFHLDDAIIEVTASIGIAAIGEGETIDDQRLIYEADIAMFNAKRNGRDRFSWFEPAMESELRFRNKLETGIRRAITSSEFTPYYQKQVDIETGELVGFEMLARWNSKELGEVSPEIFIPIAEEMGVISDLSQALISKAVEDAKAWDPRLILSVNISPVQLRDPWFSQKLLRTLVEAGFPPERLEIEITESCLHENIGIVRSMMTSLKNQGIRVSLDDFGTGYSSLSQLRSLPFDRLKIDRSFVMELVDEKCSAALVEAIVSLGKGLDLPITAEGIESEQVLKILRRMGKMKGQGFLYGRPASARETSAMLSAQGLLAHDNEEKGQDTDGPSPAPGEPGAAKRKIAG